MAMDFTSAAVADVARPTPIAPQATAAISASRVAFLLVIPVISYLQTLRRFAFFAAITGCAPVMPFSDAPSAVIQISVAQNLI
jgi:hypothetical protein